MLQLSLDTTKLSVYICLSWLGIIPFGFRSEFNLNEIPDTNHITGFVDSSFESIPDEEMHTNVWNYRLQLYISEQCKWIFKTVFPAESLPAVDRDGHGRSGTPGPQI